MCVYIYIHNKYCILYPLSIPPAPFPKAKTLKGFSLATFQGRNTAKNLSKDKDWYMANDNGCFDIF